jgi:hypothetical protein
MRADRPLLASAVFLGTGLWMIFRYGITGAGISAAMPWSNMGFQLNLAENGPAAIGGVALTAIGLLLFIWAILTALAWHASLLFDRVDENRDFVRIVPSTSWASEPAQEPAMEPLAQPIDESPPASMTGQRQFL